MEVILVDGHHSSVAPVAVVVAAAEARAFSITLVVAALEASSITVGVPGRDMEVVQINLGLLEIVLQVESISSITIAESATEVALRDSSTTVVVVVVVLVAVVAFHLSSITVVVEVEGQAPDRAVSSITALAVARILSTTQCR
jgi:hypothetical protein